MARDVSNSTKGIYFKDMSDNFKAISFCKRRLQDVREYHLIENRSILQAAMFCSKSAGLI